VNRLALLIALSSLACAAEKGYLGRDVCAGCHKDIAAAQAQTAMARTWQGTATKLLPADYSGTHEEGPEPDIQYRVRRSAKGIRFQVQMPGAAPLEFPVEATTGGSRHGLSFFIRVQNVDGVALPRAPRVETRYLYSAPDHQLALSPGFPTEKPANYETAFGRVLTPGFENKCLTCHGQPRNEGGHTAEGVTCESCHGPGQQHLAALGKKTEDKGILNPRRLPAAEQMRPCAQCHSGFSTVQDPMPDDLLISDQVRALSNSECWRQSGGEIGCVNCHNPHQDAPRDVLVAKSEKTCLGCHSAAVQKHAGLCPVNRASGCVGCHMPDTTKQRPFVIADHWIRVHPEQKVKAPPAEREWRSQVVPKHEYLRMLVLNSAEEAADVHQQLQAGGSFFDLARAKSVDQATTLNGGFLGDLEAPEMNSAWAGAALALQPGEISDVVTAGGKSYILQRMPRNFREDGEQRFNDAMKLRDQGDRRQAITELVEALKIYPRLLRALTYLGVMYAEAGNPQTGAGVLNLATRLYPEDAGAHFNLGAAYGAMGKEDEEIEEYKKALEIDPNHVPAYLNWGGALFAKGRYDEAIELYRKGIQVNPLVASLHYSLSLALEKTNSPSEAQAEMALALKINPKVAGQ